MFFLKKKIKFLSLLLGLLISFSASSIVKAADCDDKKDQEIKEILTILKLIFSSSFFICGAYYLTVVNYAEVDCVAVVD